MVTLRGRAAQPVRPGFLVQDVLSGKIPLFAREGEPEYVSEASISDLHRSYKELVRRENDLRPRAERLHGMTYESFRKLFKFAQLLELVELVREEAGPSGLLTIADGEVVPSIRKIFRLTANGTIESQAWRDLCTAWREHWPVPTTGERPEFVPREFVVFLPLKWDPTPTAREYRRLWSHVAKAKKFLEEGIELDAVREDLLSIADNLADWETVLQRRADLAAQREQHELSEKNLTRKDIVTQVSHALRYMDLDAALELIDKLLPGGAE